MYVFKYSYTISYKIYYRKHIRNIMKKHVIMTRTCTANKLMGMRNVGPDFGSKAGARNIDLGVVNT